MIRASHCRKDKRILFNLLALDVWTVLEKCCLTGSSNRQCDPMHPSESDDFEGQGAFICAFIHGSVIWIRNNFLTIKKPLNNSVFILDWLATDFKNLYFISFQSRNLVLLYKFSYKKRFFALKSPDFPIQAKKKLPLFYIYISFW